MKEENLNEFDEILRKQEKDEELLRINDEFEEIKKINKEKAKKEEFEKREKIKQEQLELRKKQIEINAELKKQQKELDALDTSSESNEKANKKRLDNAEVHTWGEFILRNNSFLTIDTTENIWSYSKKLGYFLPDGHIVLKKFCADGGPRTCDLHVLNQLNLLIQGKTFIKIEDFINPENLINLKNGVLNMDTLELIPKSPDYRFKNMLNISYNKNAKCPTWINTLKSMFSEEDYIRNQKWFGYHLLRENKEQVGVGYYGVASSGKSTMLRILVDLLGVENVTHFNLQDFNSKFNSYSIGRLYGKLANINFDMDSSPIQNIEMIKKIIAGDRMAARNIREAPFEFRFTGKVSFACNKFPPVRDRDLHSLEFKRRLMLIKVIKPSNFKKDIELYNKFSSELQSGGIFNWILEGRKMYLEDPKGFDYNHENTDKIWFKETDSVEAEAANLNSELMNG